MTKEEMIKNLQLYRRLEKTINPKKDPEALKEVKNTIEFIYKSYKEVNSIDVDKLIKGVKQ